MSNFRDMESFVAALPSEILDELRSCIKLEKRKRRATRRRQFLSKFDPGFYETRQEANAVITRINSQYLLDIPEKQRPLWERMRYLPALIAQDWSELYQCQEDGSKEEYYVYAHVDPRQWVVNIPGTKQSLGGTPFYIGKGVGNRAFDFKRNQGHGKQLKIVVEAGFAPEDIVKVVYDGLKESKALELEAKLIWFFGTVYEEGRNGVLFNLERPKTPIWEGSMRKTIRTQQWAAIRDGRQKKEVAG